MYQVPVLQELELRGQLALSEWDRVRFPLPVGLLAKLLGEALQ